MLLIKADRIHIEIDGKDIIKEASIEIHQGEHIVLIGQNGMGKTSLIKAIVGELPIIKGTLTNLLKPGEWGYMEQSPKVRGEMTTREFVESENPKLGELRDQFEKIAREMDDDLEKAEEYSELLQEYIELDGYTWETQVEKRLTQVGLDQALWEHPFDTLSGGQKTRAQLARVLTTDVKLLIMDEPTNHLDTETMGWLSQWIQKFRGAVLVISHDRAFIDQVAHFTYELTPNGTKKFKGGYKEYKEVKEHEQKTLEATYRKQEREKRELQETILNYRQWFNKAHQSAGERNPFAKKKANKNITRLQAKEKALERLEGKRVEKPRDEAKISVSFMEQSLSSRKLLAFEQVCFGYQNEHRLFHNISFYLEKEDRLAIVGPNGSGKTTLLNLLAEKLMPISGRIQKHPKLKVGYFMQELDELPHRATILDYILTVPNLTQSEARTLLACFLFQGDEVYKSIGELSMGEKCRVAFVKLYFSGANLLVLDEPTNYLDIATREQIEDALCLYPGALLIVSHDQYLIEKVANRMISLNDGFHYFPGNYKEWCQSTQGVNINREKEEELKRLDLLYAQTLSEELPDDGEDTKATHLEKLRQIKQKIEKLLID